MTHKKRRQNDICLIVDINALFLYVTSCVLVLDSDVLISRNED